MNDAAAGPTLPGKKAGQGPQLPVIVGPTASGKSALAMRIAERFDGEIVSADARQIYRGMDIGTAKATAEDRERVPHHLIDVVGPDETLTAAAYKRLALEAIGDIQARDKIAVLVGGTGLYVSAVADNLSIPEVPPDEAYREELARMLEEDLFRRLREADPAYAERIGPNPRYAIRALEVIRATGKPFSAQQKKGEPLFETFKAGLDLPKDELRRRIDARVDVMMERGLLDEVRDLLERFDPDLPAMSGIGYRELIAHVKGEMTRAEAVEAIKAHTRQYAKRQMAWFRRDPETRWFRGGEAAFEAVEKWLT